MRRLLPRGPADLRTIASVNGMLPILLGLLLAWDLFFKLIDRFFRFFGGSPMPDPGSVPYEIHLIWFALGLAAVLTSPLLYHGWDVGRLITVALGLTAIALSVVELALFAVRWTVIVFGLAWPMFVVAYLLYRGRASAPREEEPPQSSTQAG